MGKFWDGLKAEVEHGIEVLEDGIKKEWDNYNYALREMARPSDLDRPHHTPPAAPPHPHPPSHLPHVERVAVHEAGRGHDKGIEL
jgi:hypothetical protein